MDKSWKDLNQIIVVVVKIDNYIYKRALEQKGFIDKTKNNKNRQRRSNNSLSQ